MELSTVFEIGLFAGLIYGLLIGCTGMILQYSIILYDDFLMWEWINNPESWQSPNTIPFHTYFAGWLHFVIYFLMPRIKAGEYPNAFIQADYEGED